VLARLGINAATKENIFFGLFTVMIAGVGFVNTKLLSDFFSVEDFGRYQFFVTFLGLFSTFSPTGYDNFLKRSLVGGDVRPFFYYFRTVVPLIFVVLLSALALVHIMEPEHGDYMLAALVVVLFLLFDKLSTVLSAKLLFRRLRYLDFLSRLAFLGLTICALIVEMPLRHYMYALIGLHVVNHSLRAVLGFAASDRREGDLDASERMEFNRGAIRNSLVVIYATAAAWAERFILGWMNPADLAVFAIGYLIPKLVKDNVKSFLTPLFYGWSQKGAAYQFAKVREHSWRLLLLGIVATAGLCLASYVAITLFFEKYLASIPIAMLLSVSLAPLFLVYGMAHATLMSQHVSVNNRVEMMGSTMKIVGAFALVPVFSVWGAVASIMISETFRLGMYIFYFRRIDPDV
jgi:O-antigen/teichoic acid export membrane protein